MQPPLSKDKSGRIIRRVQHHGFESYWPSADEWEHAEKLRPILQATEWPPHLLPIIPTSANAWWGKYRFAHSSVAMWVVFKYLDYCDSIGKIP